MNAENMEKIKSNQTVRTLLRCFKDNGITSVTTNSDLFPDRFDEITLQIDMDVKSFVRLIKTQIPWYDIEEGANGIYVGWYGGPLPDELLTE